MFAFASTPLVSRNRRSTLIADDIQKRITDETLKPGDKLPTEAVLCQHYKVSRTTLREAIQMLRTKGLLDVTPGRGSFIRTPDPRQWMMDMVAVCRGHNVAHTHVLPFRVMAQRHIVKHLAHVPPNTLVSLARHAPSPSHTAEDNLTLEHRWLVHMAELTGNPLNAMITDCLAILDTPARRRRWADAAQAAKLCMVHGVVSQALSRGAWAEAEQALWHFMAGDTLGSPSQAEQSTVIQQPLSVPQTA